MRLILSLVCFVCWLGAVAQNKLDNSSVFQQAEKVLHKEIMNAAAMALKEKPVTVTASSSPRSAGGKHDFFSEGDYWWPDSLHPDSPYIQRDGMTNPDNFVAHRLAMIRFSQIVGSLASAWRITHRRIYLKKRWNIAKPGL